MRPENKRMQELLKSHGIKARVKYISSGSMRGVWRLYEPGTNYTQSLYSRLNDLGFVNFDGRPLDIYSGAGGTFQVFVRGHNELL